MTNQTIANELRDEIIWDQKLWDFPVNHRVLDVAVHEVSAAWNGPGVYRIQSPSSMATAEWGREYKTSFDLGWDAYHAALGADLWDVLDTAFSVDYLGESF